MMLLALVLVPVCAGLLALVVPGNAFKRWLPALAGGVHLTLTAAVLARPPAPAFGGWLLADSLGLLFLMITSALFLAAAVYAVAYLERETSGPRADWVEGELFSNAPVGLFAGCLLFFLGSMTLVTLSQHLGLLWIALEATTLSSAPLIYFHRHHRSLEAAWKYLMVASVGITLALLGTFFLALAAKAVPGSSGSLLLRDLLAPGRVFDLLWLKASFILLLVGYGTKMGLAPFYSWLPDAHGEAPSLVSALLSGALLNCALLGILRAYQVLQAAGEAAFGQGLLVGFGLFSLAVAAVSIFRQADYKRMLAYSSVGHMGIIALGVGIGGAATLGAMFHAVNHSLAKGMLFLVAGNILAVYHTTATRGVRGALHAIPVSGYLWIAGLFAISGMPPFGSFSSEFTIVVGAVREGRLWLAGVFLALTALVFLGMASVVLRMAQGEIPSRSQVKGGGREAVLAVVPPAVLVICALVLGLYLPPALDRLLSDAAGILGGSR